MQVPLFCSATYEAVSKVIDGELAINLFCEQAESAGARSPIAMLKAPGKELFSQVPEAGVNAMYTVNGRTFIAGSQLYELFSNGSTVVRGSLGGTQPLRQCQMASNETQLIALNNGNLYILTLATNAFVAVNMAQLQGGAGSVAQVGFADGYFVAWFLNTHTFQTSILEDGTTWSGLDVTTNSLFPDNFVTMICDHREIWFFSAKKSVGYYNAGAGNPPFIPIQGAFAEFGAASLSATVQLDNSVFWIGADERGTAVAYRLEGYSERRISTHAVEFAWQNYSTVADTIAYTYQEQGHSFWVIYFPSANATWCYDVSTQLWHQRAAWNVTNGSYDADHSQSHTFNFGKHLVGDWSSGNIYHQSAAIQTDNGGILRWTRRSPTQHDELNWIYFSEFQVDMQVGAAPQIPSGQVVPGGTPISIPGTAMPWNPNDAGAPYYVTVAGTPGILIPCNPGQVITLAYRAGTSSTGPAPPFPLTDGLGQGVGTTGGVHPWPSDRLPGGFATGSQGECCGAFIDGSGVVLTAVRIDNGVTLVPAPAGTVNLSIGVNDNHSFADNTGSWNYVYAFGNSIPPNSPQTQLFDGNGNPRPAQVIFRWSDDGGETWSNSYYLSVGYSGEFFKRVRKTMLGRSRKRVWELSGTDPVPTVIVNAYCHAEQSLENQTA
jgi:hypothetical protein